MSGRRHKKLNLLIKFSNFIFTKFYFKPYWRWTFIQNNLACYVSSILSYLQYLPSRCKKAKISQGLYLLNPNQDSAMNPLQSLQHLEASHLQFTTFENSVFVQKRTLVKLLG